MARFPSRRGRSLLNVRADVRQRAPDTDRAWTQCALGLRPETRFCRKCECASRADEPERASAPYLVRTDAMVQSNWRLIDEPQDLCRGYRPHRFRSPLRYGGG